MMGLNCAYEIPPMFTSWANKPRPEDGDVSRMPQPSVLGLELKTFLFSLLQSFARREGSHS